jgi:flagellar motor switch protein FliM
MSEDDLLSQEEKDALIKGVESGDVDTDQTDIGSSEARAFNFASRELRLLDSLHAYKRYQNYLLKPRAMRLEKCFAQTPQLNPIP